MQSNPNQSRCLNLDILQFLGNLANRGDLWLRGLLNLTLCLLGGGILWQLLREWNKLWGAWEVLSKRLWNVETLGNCQQYSFI